MSAFPEIGSARHSLLVFSAIDSLKKAKAAMDDKEYALAQGFYGAARRDLACIGHSLAKRAGEAEQFARVLAETGEESLDG